MAHDGTGTGWDETSPANTEAVGSGDDEIRDLRKGVRIRLEKEHVLPAGSSVGGEHLEGSAKVYRQAAAPTQRPDASTSLGSDDDGRLWLDSDDDFLYVWNGSAWEKINAAADGGINTTQIANDAVDKDKIAADIAGVGLGQNANGSLEVNVDDSTIEVSTDTLQIKSGGVGTTQLAAGAVTDAKLASGIVGGVGKAWLVYNQATDTTIDSLNISGVVDNGTGDFTVSFDTDFGSTNYGTIATARDTGVTADTVAGMKAANTKTVGSIQLNVYQIATGAIDSTEICCFFFGDQ